MDGGRVVRMVEFQKAVSVALSLTGLIWDT